MNTTRNLFLAAAVAALSTVSYAQAPAASAPENVGVSPSESRESMEKAVPREDTATVTRSSESEAERARDAAEEARDKAQDAREAAQEAREETREARDAAGNTTSGTSSSDTSATTSTTTTTTDTMTATERREQEMRTPRADRN